MRVPTGLLRGTIDTGAPLAARWYDDDDCNDEFAREVMRALDAMLEPHASAIRWPAPPELGIDGVFIGRRTPPTPSVVFHAAAVGQLLELGFFPTARCVQRHLRVLHARVVMQQNAKDPSAGDDGWALRTRHVAWVLACLAEMPHNEGLVGTRDPSHKKAVELHSKVLQSAYRYLVSMPMNPSSEDPSSWIARRPDESAWTEYYEGRAPNLLNTLYALLGLCRAERHGFGSSGGNGSPFEELDGDVRRLILDALEITSTGGGLVIRLNGEWHEPWAQAPLPTGVIALISLVLVEYAGMLHERGRLLGTARRAAEAQLMSQRLAHRLAATVNEWWKHADVFLRTDAEGYWFLPTYGLALRALLESGAVGAFSSVVSYPFATIEATEVPHGPDRSTTWLDPTRTEAVRRTLAGVLTSGGEESVKAYGHHLVELVPPVEGDRATPAGLHAAVMAYSALRRAVTRADPREVLHPPARRPASARPRPFHPASPFTWLSLDGGGERQWSLELRFPAEGPPVYRETITIGSAQAALLLALEAADRPLTLGELYAALPAFGWPRAQNEKSVGAAIEELNRRVAVGLVVGKRREDGSHAYSINGVLVLPRETSAQDEL